jgi:hypothetical protein
MNETNSFLIETEKVLVPVDAKLQAARPRYYLNHQWADVKIEKVRQVMREAYVNKNKREQLAKKAAADIHQNYSPARIGMIMKNLLG